MPCGPDVLSRGNIPRGKTAGQGSGGERGGDSGSGERIDETQSIARAVKAVIRVEVSREGEWSGGEPIHASGKRAQSQVERRAGLDERVDIEIPLSQQRLRRNAADVRHFVLDSRNSDVTSGKEEQVNGVIHWTAEVGFETEKPRASAGHSFTSMGDHHRPGRCGGCLFPFAKKLGSGSNGAVQQKVIESIAAQPVCGLLESPASLVYAEMQRDPRKTGGPAPLEVLQHTELIEDGSGFRR
jgi:hypothetical protein